MSNNQYITCPIDGITTILNTRGRLAQYMREHYKVRGYVTQSDTPYFFHIADVIRCLIRDRNKTLQFLNLSVYGFKAKQFKDAMTTHKRFYYDGEVADDQPKSKAVKELIKKLWTNNEQLYTESEARDVLGESLWTEFLSHDHYVTLESKIFETPLSTDLNTEDYTPSPTQTLSHTHDDGTFCLTAEQYEIAKQQDLLRFMTNTPKIVLQRAASH